MKKKLTIIGRGTAGCYAASHFARHTDLEVELYHDPNAGVQSVGESGPAGFGNTMFPKTLQINFGMNYSDLDSVNGSIKLGVAKLNWDSGEKYVNWFPAGSTSYHFNARALQDLILDRLKDRVRVIPERIDVDNIDSDFIMDCSGKPGSMDDFHYLTDRDDSIPVNAAYVVECLWDSPKYNVTHAVARPYGWAFAVPLANRLSIGYLYNKNINTLEEVKEDAKELFRQFGVTPSEQTQSLQFNNYYRKQNFNGRVCYNGNQSFFLEPMEATAIWTMNYIQHLAHNVWLYDKPIQEANEEYVEKLNQIETCIMLHYFVGSKFDTEFWRFAKERADRHIKRALQLPKFQKALSSIMKVNLKQPSVDALERSYGIWNHVIWADHFSAWNVSRKLLNL